MKQKAIFYTIFILTVSLCISLFFNYKQHRDSQREPAESIVVERESETKTEVKEEKFTAPNPVNSKVTEKISIKKPKISKKSELNAEITSKIDSIPEIISSDEEMITETDSTYEVPITQKVYGDSTYTAWVSGFHVSLDSIVVRNKIITHSVRETITKTKKQRFTIGLQGGLYLTPKGFQPGIGIGGSWNF